MLGYLVAATNQILLEQRDATPREIEGLAAARRQTEQELTNSINLIAGGASRPRDLGMRSSLERNG